ncbi:MAG: DNA adenine methylase [Vulcanimicrobiota bacterium]
MGASTIQDHQVYGPVLKWAGGKGRLLAQYEPYFPAEFKHYYEPFVGSAAVFFHLRRQATGRAVLSDVNFELINFYRALQSDLEGLLEHLAEHRARHGHDYYYATRALDPESLTPTARAARLFYLNKTCYNGLYRVNSRGLFNVPMGRYKKPAIFDPGRLEAASLALQGVKLEVEPFDRVMRRARPGDLVYFDPPYQPLSATSNFTSYTKDNFGEAEQRRLAEVFAKLAQRGVSVMLSNSSAPLIRELYRDFRQIEVQAHRFINSKASRRNKIKELLIVAP